MKWTREDELRLAQQVIADERDVLLGRYRRVKNADDIEAYVKSLRLKLGDSRYVVFLEAMNDFRIRRINRAGSISRMRQVLKEHPDLMDGFMELLPDEYGATTNFLSNSKELLVRTEDDSVYRTFLKILNNYCFESKAKSEVYREMASMSFFRDHPDMLAELKVFFKVDLLKEGRKKYRKILFSCEDDMFELDMLLESFKQTVNCVEELLEKFNDGTIDPDDPIRLEDHFSSRNLSCVRYIYGKSGPEVDGLMQTNAIHALPVILMRLKQKQEEGTRFRAECNKVWAEIFAKYHRKTLGYFKTDLLNEKE
ncbi:hypothetical protein NE237_016307 [Protea cynaroides]|uniref:Histone deacetylase interacting domain-containing protein n=1 Tax=Protea cynaroides TaxID=273540 RepID=A0A9Q0GN34_9MAGN|nr:hypothetical protein NE237_016307 [Protea cynaroides]